MWNDPEMPRYLLCTAILLLVAGVAVFASMKKHGDD